jgi:hypothetical protein
MVISVTPTVYVRIALGLAWGNFRRLCAKPEKERSTRRRKEKATLVIRFLLKAGQRRR